MPHLGELPQQLSAIIDALDGPRRRLRIIGSNVLVNVLQPPLGLERPGYCCHERMRRPISSFEIARFASASARPRATMA